MKVLFIYADGFEDTEAVASRDVLVRAGLEVVDSTINESGEVVSSHKMHFKGLKRLSETNYDEFSAIVLPGGSRGVNNLLNSDEVIKAVKYFYNSNKLVCAICAAPMVLNKADVLKGRYFTCYPGCEVGLSGKYTRNEVEVVDKLITARSMSYSVPFGLAIIENLLGIATKERILKQISGK